MVDKADVANETISPPIRLIRLRSLRLMSPTRPTKPRLIWSTRLLTPLRSLWPMRLKIQQSARVEKPMKLLSLRAYKANKLTEPLILPRTMKPPMKLTPRPMRAQSTKLLIQQSAKIDKPMKTTRPLWPIRLTRSLGLTRPM